MTIPARKADYKHRRVIGYIRLGSRYVSKAFLVAAFTAFFAFGVIYMTALHPVAVQLWYKYSLLPEFKTDSPYLAEYTGQARLLLPDGTLLYEGYISGAVIGGTGRLYKDGVLLYDGGFQDNMFEGHGTLYNRDGSLYYTGGFAGNMPHSSGTMYFKRDGADFIYTGDFDAGVQSGAGKLFRDGRLLYEGGFSEGVFSGTGTKYDGEFLYTGSFADGLYNGDGKLYQNGQLIYEGAFGGGLRNGAGREYDGGVLRYDGMFLNGLYDGDGKLYDGLGHLIYEGGFVAGLYGGAGAEYSPDTGFPIFEGKYLDGIRMEAGVEYDAHGVPVAEPVSRLDPLSMFDLPYREVLAALTADGTLYREQALDDRHMVVDDANGVLYAFAPGGDGGVLTEVYLCGLAAAGELVVGATIDAPPSELILGGGAAELFALNLSNSLWGENVKYGELAVCVFESGGLALEAFCTFPPEPEYEPDPDADAGFVYEMKAPEGKIVFLRVSRHVLEKEIMPFSDGERYEK